MGKNASRDGYYPGIDLVRFAAAALVVFYHLCVSFRLWPSSEHARILAGMPNFQPLTGATWLGWIGVEIFFAVSGLVIVNSASSEDGITFLRSRILRLYPGAWICATITVLVLLLAPIKSDGQLLRRYLDSVSLWPRGPWIDGVYWTLAIEIAFYACIFVLLACRAFRRLEVFCWVMTVSSFTYLCGQIALAYRLAPAPEWMVWLLRPRYLSDMLLLRQGVLFATGIWIWKMKGDGFSRGRILGFALSVCGGGLEIFLNSTEIARTLPLLAGVNRTFPLVLWIFAVGALYWAAHRPATALRSPRTLHVTRRLGLLTYPLYLLHALVGAELLYLCFACGISRYPALIITVVSLCLLAWLVSAQLEPRLRSWLARGLDWLGGKLPLTILARR